MNASLPPTARTVDVPQPTGEKLYNTVLRRPDTIWYESEEDENDSQAFPVDSENTEALMWSEAAFEIWAVIDEAPEGEISRRFIRIAEGPPMLIVSDDCIAILKAARAVERIGGTFNFAFSDEDKIDHDDKYHRFARLLRTWDVREQRTVWEPKI